MSENKNNPAIAGGLLLAVIFWGGNNAGTKWLLGSWPPFITGATRFLCAGIILSLFVRLLAAGPRQNFSGGIWRLLWLRGGFSLAIYILFYALALRLIPVSHLALYLGASPIWALLGEGRPKRDWSSARRYGAAILALAGVTVLFWPVLKTGNSNFIGEVLGLFASLTWANFSHQSRLLAKKINGLEIASNSMWMAGIWLMPMGVWEIFTRTFPLDAPHLGVQALCIVFGSVLPYAFWNTALRHWQTSRVMLFNNLIPLTTTLWAHYTLGEPITPTFCAAMILIIAGVFIGQVDWQKIFKLPESF